MRVFSPFAHAVKSRGLPPKIAGQQLSTQALIGQSLKAQLKKDHPDLRRAANQMRVTTHPDKRDKLLAFLRCDNTPLITPYQPGFSPANPTSQFAVQGVENPKDIATLTAEKRAILIKYSKAFDFSSEQTFFSKSILSLAVAPEITRWVTGILGPQVILQGVARHGISPQEGGYSSLTTGIVKNGTVHSDLNAYLAYRYENYHLRQAMLNRNMVNVWVCLSGNTLSQAPLFVFPTTHRWAPITIWDYKKAYQDQPDKQEEIADFLSNEDMTTHRVVARLMEHELMLHPTFAYGDQLAEIKKQTFTTQPGQFIGFNTHNLHGSDFNASPNERIALVFRYGKSDETVPNTNTLQQLKSKYSEEEIRQFVPNVSENKVPALYISGLRSNPSLTPIHLHKLLEIMAKKNFY